MDAQFGGRSLGSIGPRPEPILAADFRVVKVPWTGKPSNSSTQGRGKTKYT